MAFVLWRIVRLLIVVGDIENVLEYLFVGIGEFDVSSCHNSFGNCKEFCERYVGKACARTFGKTWDEIAWKAGAMDVYANSNNSGSVEYAIDACF